MEELKYIQKKCMLLRSYRIIKYKFQNYTPFFQQYQITGSIMVVGYYFNNSLNNIDINHVLEKVNLNGYEVIFVNAFDIIDDLQNDVASMVSYKTHCTQWHPCGSLSSHVTGKPNLIIQQAKKKKKRLKGYSLP